MKTDRHGIACLLSDADYSKIRKQIKSRKYKLLFDLAQEPAKDGGQRVQLRIEDCYLPDGSPRDYINFRARTRKAAPDGKRQTRICVRPCGFAGVTLQFQARVKLSVDVCRSHWGQTYNPKMG